MRGNAAKPKFGKKNKLYHTLSSIYPVNVKTTKFYKQKRLQIRFLIEERQPKY